MIRFIIGFVLGVITVMLYGLLQYLTMTARDWRELKEELDRAFGKYQ